MAPPVEIARICTFCCFNFVYLFLGFVYLLVAVDLNAIKTESTTESSTLTSLVSLNWIIGFHILFVAVFGFVAFCMNKSRLIFTVSCLFRVELEQMICSSIALLIISSNFISSVLAKTSMEFWFRSDSLYRSPTRFWWLNRKTNWPRSRWKPNCPNLSSSNRLCKTPYRSSSRR